VEEDAEIRRFRGRVWVIPRSEPPPEGFRAPWPGTPTWRIPELDGVLRFRSTSGHGLAAAAVAAGKLEVRLRRGGERLRIAPGGPRRELKTLLQEGAVPPWERGRLPLLYSRGRLAWAARVGVAAEFRAGPGERGLEPVWEPAGGGNPGSLRKR
jgi:tRNA(Ile)-lysidine synthase